MIRTLLGAILALAAASPAHPWGAQGHAAVGLIAEQNLRPETQRRIEALMGSTDLAGIASWMDDLRSATRGYGRLASDAGARQFAARFPHNDEWHFVDLPLAEPGYPAGPGPFTRPDDIVHEMHQAIDVLEGRDRTIPPRIALYMLVHFIGDLHQPLHVACGFYDLSDPAHPRLLTDPTGAAGHPSDQGANKLSYGPGNYDNLHGMWDTRLPQAAAGGSREPRALARRALADVPASAASTPGDYHAWPEAWAAESIAAANELYAGVALGTAEPDDRGLRKIHVTLPPAYEARMAPLAEKRIAQAGYRLAALLNDLAWPAVTDPAPSAAP